MSLLMLLLIILVVGALVGYGNTRNAVWIVLAVILVLFLVGGGVVTR